MCSGPQKTRALSQGHVALESVLLITMGKVVTGGGDGESSQGSSEARRMGSGENAFLSLALGWELGLGLE